MTDTRSSSKNRRNVLQKESVVERQPSRSLKIQIQKEKREDNGIKYPQTWSTPSSRFTYLQQSAHGRRVSASLLWLHSSTR